MKIKEFEILSRSINKSGSIMISVIVIFILILILSMPISSQSTPPSDGDWIVKDQERAEHRSITLNGDLVIKNGGELILNDVDLKFNSAKDYEYKIHIEDGGELEIRYSKINFNSDHSIVIIVEPDGNFDIYNSTISDFTTIESETKYSGSTFGLMIAGVSIIVVIVVVIILIFIMVLFTKKRIKYIEELKKMIDITGVVEDTIIPGQFTGTIKIESEVKSAITKGSENIKSGENVNVVDVENVSLVVEKLEK